MRLGVLFSGGKDSVFAMYKAMQEKNKIACLISIVSKNPESYMFHTPNIELTRLQAEALGIPLLTIETAGVKEKELEDLERAIKIAKDNYKIEGIVTGAIQSVYQASRINHICTKLKLGCLNPLWQADQEKYIKEFISLGFKAIITAVASYPFDEKWLGRELSETTLQELIILNKKAAITITGEGGEFESLVIDGPIFKKRLEIVKATKSYKNYAGLYKIEESRLVLK